MDRLKSFWGWGYANYKVDEKRVQMFEMLLKGLVGETSFSDIPAPSIENIHLRLPRFSIPKELQSICTSEKRGRISHSYGKSFRDIWRASRGLYNNPPDYIAFPKEESDIMALFTFAAKNKVSIIPYGGGTSVVGGIEPTLSNEYQGVITVDMKHFDKILEIDKKSRCARIQAGIFGPELEKKLKPHGLTLRHFPQSFEFSTLGGWIVTRSGGHFATLFTHIDEFLQSVRMVTPSGVMESRRLPGSGAGPSEERFIAGTEGIFGIVTEAWMRLQDIPKHRAAQTVNFSTWEEAIDACRQIAQSGLNPANTRLVDQMEAMINGLGDGKYCVIILGFESAHRDMKPYMDQALEICKKTGGSWTVKEKTIKRDTKADEWKTSFLEAPYLRDIMVRKGYILETFETAVTW
ncbi:MAG: FAD-binding oxidoreductase, partial [Saprospiraceae bacterium]